MNSTPPAFQFPVMTPFRPDGKGILAQGGQLTDGQEADHIVPLFGNGFRAGNLLISVGSTQPLRMQVFTREGFQQVIRFEKPLYRAMGEGG